MWNKKYMKRMLVFMALIVAVAALPVGCGETVSEETETKEASVQTEEITFTPSPVTAPADEKKETVHVKAAADGSVREITVKTKLTCPEGTDDIRDYTRLSDIKNTTGDEEFVLDRDGTLIWQNHGADITYEGSSREQLPVDVKLTYWLEGKKISPEALAGQSGAVKIRFDYTNYTLSEETAVPFLALSFMVLSGSHFSNVEVENGKVMEMDDDLIVFGAALPGLDERLSLEDLEATEDVELPQFVEITADATDFDLDFTETIITSGLFAEIEDEDLDDLSDLKKKAKKLDRGVDELLDGTDSLSDGMKELKKYVKEYTDGVSSLHAGIGKLDENLNALNQNKDTMISGLATLGAQIEAMKPMLSEEEFRSLQQLLAGMQGYVDAVDLLAEASTQLKSGSNQLAGSGNALTEAMDELIDGTGRLKEGLEKLDDQGIAKMTKLLGTDFQKIVKQVRALKAADVDYKSFAGCLDGQESSVSFWIETEEI